MAGADWSTLTVPGAFVVGAVLGAVAVLRVGRIVVDYLRRRDDVTPPE